MHPKQNAKIITDCAMIFFLPVLMAYSLLGETLHEWIGLAMLLCLILHHVLNIHKPSLKTPVARINTALDFVLLIMLLLLMGSGIVLSKTVFRFLPFDGGWATARAIHLPLAYWSYILMSVHLGLHLNSIFTALQKMKNVRWLYLKKVALRIAVMVVSMYGGYAFLSRDFPSYMFLRNHFVFTNYDEPIVCFFADYLAVMTLFAVLSHLMIKFAQQRKMNKEEIA